MANPYFSFKQFTVFHNQCAMKVTTDACLFGAWCAHEINSETKQSVLDIGTGSGLLALMIAQKNNVKVDAVEIDFAAAEQARYNVAASPFAEKITVYNADILNFEKKDFDVIISNPPFCENDLKAPLAASNMAHHDTGLRWGRLLQLIKDSLAPKGSFYLLLPFKRKAEFETLCSQNGLDLEATVLVKQTPQHAPFRMLVKGTTQPAVTNTTELTICIQRGSYTAEFIHLLKDYYLYL